MSLKDSEELQEKITHVLLRVINKIEVGRRTPRHYGEAGMLTLLEAEICNLVLRSSGITGSELAKELGVSASAISHLVSKLKEKKLIREEFAEGNAKRKLLYLTPQGKKAANVALQYFVIMKQKLFDTSSKELQAYYRFVLKLEELNTDMEGISPFKNDSKKKK